MVQTGEYSMYRVRVCDFERDVDMYKYFEKLRGGYMAGGASHADWDILTSCDRTMALRVHSVRVT